MLNNWICCQIGAREHYAIPRALHQQGVLSKLITDVWVKPASSLHQLPKNLGKGLTERFHPDLYSANVKAFNSSAIKFEIFERFIGRHHGWEKIIIRNEWFQKLVKSELDKYSSIKEMQLFTYSYAGLEALKYAKSKNWKTILGQIDPGPIEEKIVTDEYHQREKYGSKWVPAPQQYWDKWYEECEIADTIIVNSEWSARAIIKAGIPPIKVQTFPLAYEAPLESKSFVRTYPSSFSSQRPLRVLFLGQIILRKGIAALLEAAEQMLNLPVEFWLVGPIGINPSSTFVSDNVKMIGPVNRSNVYYYYQNADLFLFPTLSDGFGMTQLEAQAWKLPGVVSDFCANVYEDGYNGIVLKEVTGRAIAQALESLICPERLFGFSQNINLQEKYSLNSLAKSLISTFDKSSSFGD